MGAEGDKDDPRILHGPNPFPDDSLPEMRPVVLNYMDKMTHLAHILMRCIAKALNLPLKYFEEDLTKDPTLTTLIVKYHPHQKM